MMMDVESPWDDLVGPSTRAPRSVETRESSQRKRSWVQASDLPDPIPQDGWVFKWVRTDSMGKPDHKNFQKRRREGWEPVNASDHPEMMTELRATPNPNGHVEVGGLILCKMPQEMVDQRTAYFQDRTKAEMDAADNSYLRDDDERMKKVIEKKRQVVFGR